MLKKLIVLAFLLVLISGATGTWLIFRAYQNHRAERIARLQQQAAERSITIIEGWSLDEMGTYFEKEGLFSKADFNKALDNYDASKFPFTKRPDKVDLEGYLFPDTYRISKTATPEDVITKMLANFSQRLESIGVSDPNAQYNGLTLAQVITLASIIEKESGGQGTTTGNLSLQDERDLVASVFYNRMKIGQALESDATINYITGKDTPAASAADLEVNSPYNTYKYAGLPPGPICSPSLGSLKAALHPAESDYYYFLHKQPSGEVEFSRTFEEHKSKK